MENTNQNLPIPQPSVQPLSTSTKKWYDHKGILAITILVLIAATVVLVYFIENQPLDYGKIVIPHAKIAAQNQSVATSTPAQAVIPVVQNDLYNIKGNTYNYNNVTLYLDSSDGTNENIGVYLEKDNEKQRLLDIGYDVIGGTYAQFSTTTDPNIALVSLTTGDLVGNTVYDYIDLSTGKYIQINAGSESGFDITDSTGNKVTIDYTYQDTCSHDATMKEGQKAYLTGLSVNGISAYKFTNAPVLTCLPVDEDDAFPEPYGNPPGFALMNLKTNLSSVYFSAQIINDPNTGSVAWQSNFVYDLSSKKLSQIP